MFVRTVCNRYGHRYLMIVENYWESGKTRQRVLMNMGRLDMLQATGQLDRITESLARYCEKVKLVDLSKDVSIESTYVFGSVDVLKRLFERTPLLGIMENVVESHPDLELPLIEVVFALLVSRFVSPCSKLSLKENWLDRFYPELVCQDIALHHIYRTLDLLAQHKEEIQKSLLYPASQLSLFEVPKLELVFYDTTTLRFESTREDLGELCRFGYSKERRSDCTQVILGLMLEQEGLPVGYKLFPGNTYEGKTLPIVLTQLKKEYGIKRLIFVADRGMINTDNLDVLNQNGFEFIIGMKLWAMKKAEQKQITGIQQWDYEKAEYKVKELPHPEGRLIVTWSADRAKRDVQVRCDLLEKLKTKLKKEDDPSSLITHKGFKRYLKTTQKGKVAINQKAINAEAKRDGLFGIVTNTTQEVIPAQEILTRYKELWKIEDAFGEIKGTLEARPMFHWTDKRIEGHMMICFLAYYLEAFVTQKLRKENANFTAPTAFDALNQIRAVPVKVKNQTVWVRTKIEGVAAKTYQTLKIRIPGDVLRLPSNPEPDSPTKPPSAWKKTKPGETKITPSPKVSLKSNSYNF